MPKVPVKSHKCGICAKPFQWKYALKQHLESHEISRPRRFACTICKKAFYTIFNLNEHINHVHRQLKKHFCVFCKKGFCKSSQLNRHILFEIREKQFWCKNCGKEAYYYALVDANVKTRTQEKPHKEQSEEPKNVYNVNIKRVLNCDQCRRLNTPNFPFKIHKCGTCFKTFRSKQNLKFHEEIHDIFRRRTYQCAKCKKLFYNAYKLETHVRCVHQNIKTHQCVFCDKRFYLLSGLNIHIIRHVGEKHFWCNKCEKELSCKTALNSHRKGHVIYKPYKCDQCSSSFLNRWRLQRHKRFHKANCFECVVCLKTFATSCQLLQHIPCHLNEKPHFCPFCDEEFKYRNALNFHLRKSHKQRPKKRIEQFTPFCVFCLKFFRSRLNLMRHISSHLNEKPFICSICETEFKDPRGLKSHLERIKCKKVKVPSFNTSTQVVNIVQLEEATTSMARDQRVDVPQNSEDMVDVNAPSELHFAAATGEYGHQSNSEGESLEDCILVGVVKTCGVCKEKFSGEKADKKYAMHIVAEKHYIMKD